MQDQEQKCNCTSMSAEIEFSVVTHPPKSMNAHHYLGYPLPIKQVCIQVSVHV